MTPRGMSRTRNDSFADPGVELKEYDRRWSVPGTSTFTYWPAR